MKPGVSLHLFHTHSPGPGCGLSTQRNPSVLHHSPCLQALLTHFTDEDAQGEVSCFALRSLRGWSCFRHRHLSCRVCKVGGRRGILLLAVFPSLGLCLFRKVGHAGAGKALFLSAPPERVGLTAVSMGWKGKGRLPKKAPADLTTQLAD